MYYNIHRKTIFQPIFDFEFGSNMLFQLLVELKASNLHFVFCPLRFQTRFMQPIQWMRVKINLFRLHTTLHYLEYNQIPHFGRLFLLLARCRCNC
jgi:hypothetical protein